MGLEACLASCLGLLEACQFEACRANERVRDACLVLFLEVCALHVSL